MTDEEKLDAIHQIAYQAMHTRERMIKPRDLKDLFDAAWDLGEAIEHIFEVLKRKSRASEEAH